MRNHGKMRLSHSALESLVVCERKFQLDRLLEGTIRNTEYASMTFGKAWGAGIATYLETQDEDKAIFDLWMSYNSAIQDDRRTEEVCINMLRSAVPKLNNLLLDWEPAHIEGKPSSELSFCLNIDPDFYYVGYIDKVMKNKYSGRYGIFEVKTTGLNLTDLAPIYQNSNQGVGYSIALDRIAGAKQSDYDLIYIVGQLGSGTGFSPNIHVMTFPKNIKDRFNWFISLGLDVDRIKKMLELDVFPLRGKNCLQYNKPCTHFGLCTLYSLDRYKRIEEDTTDYDFVYELNEIITDHIGRV